MQEFELYYRKINYEGVYKSLRFNSSE